MNPNPDPAGRSKEVLVHTCSCGSVLSTKAIPAGGTMFLRSALVKVCPMCDFRPATLRTEDFIPPSFLPDREC